MFRDKNIHSNKTKHKTTAQMSLHNEERMLVTYDKWREIALAKHKLQIKDIFKLKYHSTISLLILDGEIWVDTVFQNQKQPKFYDPKTFFQYNFATYIHDHGLTGTLILHTKNGTVRYENFEFWVEVPNTTYLEFKHNDEPYVWKQLVAGYINTDRTNRHIHWVELPKTTGVGYKGPMIELRIVNIMPNIIID
jgi:hypothetical protein